MDDLGAAWATPKKPEHREQTATVNAGHFALEQGFTSLFSLL